MASWFFTTVKLKSKSYRLTSGFFLFESKLGSLRESHSGLHCFWSRRCDWSRKLVPALNQSATKLNQAQPAHRRFPALFHNEFSLDPCELFLRSYWLLQLLWWRFQKSQLKNALSGTRTLESNKVPIPGSTYLWLIFLWWNVTSSSDHSGKCSLASFMSGFPSFVSTSLGWTPVTVDVSQ